MQDTYTRYPENGMIHPDFQFSYNTFSPRIMSYI